MDVKYITNVQEYDQLVEELYNHTLIAIDYEFTSLDVYAATLLLMSIAYNDQIGYVIDWTVIPIVELQKLKPILENPRVIKIAHNFTVEWKYTYHFAKIQIQGIHDTLVAEQMIHAGLNYRFGLKEVTERRLGFTRDKEIRKEFIEWQLGQTFSQEQITYSGEDVTTLFEIYRQQVQDIEARELNRIYDLEMAIIPPTALMEYQGVPINESMLQGMIEPFTRFADSAEKAFQDVLIEHGAADELIFDKHGYRAVNADSPTQVKQALVKLGIEITDKSGKLSLNSKAVQRWDMAQARKKGKKHKDFEIDFHTLLDDDEVADALDLYTMIENKIVRSYMFMVGARKLVNTFIIGMLAAINPRTKRIHPGFKSYGAHRTGRYSSTHPNFQNIPNDRKLQILGLGKYSIRHAIEAPEGYQLIIADYSGIELVILAILAGDTKLFDQIVKGDIHTYVTQEIFRIDIPKGKKKDHPYRSWRDGSKRTSYSIAYGTTGMNLSESLNIDLAAVDKKFTKLEGDQIIEDWFKLFPDTAKYLETNAVQAITRFYTTDSWGRRRNWDRRILYPSDPDKRVQNEAKWLRFAACREGKNQPIQSTSATMTKLAIRLLWEQLDRKKARIIITVHDECVLLCRNDYVEEARRIMKWCMEEGIRQTLPSIAHMVGEYESLSVSPQASMRYDK
jgi:DNA polymerase I